MNSFRIVRNNFKRSWNRRIGFIANLMIPIVVVILGIFANSVSKPSFSFGIVNGENQPGIVSTLSQTNGITVSEANEDSIKIDLITGKFAAIVSFSNSDYELFTVKSEKTNHQLKEIIDRYKISSIPLDIEEIVGTKLSFAQRTIAFILLFLMVTSTVTASYMIIDKNNGTLKRYQYSPQKPTSYIWGNFIYNYLITFLQFMLAITFTQVFDISLGISYWNLILAGVWLSGVATAYGTFFSSIFRKEMYANLFATFLALILSLIGGSFIVFENMPAMLQKISIISPLRWFIEITNNMENGVSWFENVGQVVILSAMIVAFFIPSLMKRFLAAIRL